MAAQDNPAPVGRKRITLLKVPLDIVPPEEFQEIICTEFLNPQFAPGVQTQGMNFALLSLWDLLRARRQNEFREYVLRASLVVPVSKSLAGGARFLAGKTLFRYMPFHFVIDLLTILESRENSIYLLGGKDKILKRVENNIHQTFPGLRIVGRCAASFRRQEEGAIVEAIRKTSPHLLLVGQGVRGGELWIARNSAKLNRGMRVYCGELFDVFAEKRRRTSDAVFKLGLEAISPCLRNPLKILRIFPYFRYKFLLLFYKIFNKN